MKRISLSIAATLAIVLVTGCGKGGDNPKSEEDRMHEALKEDPNIKGVHEKLVFNLTQRGSSQVDAEKILKELEDEVIHNIALRNICSKGIDYLPTAERLVMVEGLPLELETQQSEEKKQLVKEVAELLAQLIEALESEIIGDSQKASPHVS